MHRLLLQLGVQVAAAAVEATLVVRYEKVGNGRLVLLPAPQGLYQHIAIEPEAADLGDDLIVGAQPAHDGVALHHRKVPGQVLCKPGVLPDLGQGDPLEWVHQQHARDQVAGTGGKVARQVVDAACGPGYRGGGGEAHRSVAGQRRVPMNHQPAGEGIPRRTKLGRVQRAPRPRKQPGGKGTEAARSPGDSPLIFLKRFGIFSSSNGSDPQSRAYRMTPQDQMSTSGPAYSLPLITSGAA